MIERPVFFYKSSGGGATEEVSVNKGPLLNLQGVLRSRLRSTNLTIISQINGDDTNDQCEDNMTIHMNFWILLGRRLRGEGAWSSGRAC